jgi:hypothetical protein
LKSKKTKKMTLSFKTQIAEKPNYFIEKIWWALIDNDIIGEYHNSTKELSQYRFDYFELFGIHWDGQCRKVENKLHTIREDKHDRWKAGKVIHPVINNRTPNRFQFAPCFPCVTVLFQVELQLKLFPALRNRVLRVVVVLGRQA